MKPIAEWPLIVKLTSLAGVLGTLGTVWSYKDALAEIIPYATKTFVIAQVQAVQHTIEDKSRTITDSLDAIAWNQLLDREQALSSTIESMRTAKIQLRSMIEREENHEELISKQVRLDALETELGLKETAYARTRCQINARDYSARCQP